MWWTVAPEHRTEFHCWHSIEHLPERLSIPGFLRGSRWVQVDDPGAFFVLYELDSHDTLASAGYLARLNAPTPWSVQMMPRHRNMTRSQCRVMEGRGAGLAGYLAPLRLSPRPGAAERLRAALVRLFDQLVTTPGLTGAHLLWTDTPATAAPTEEQRIRGGDSVADWIVLLAGHDPAAIGAALAGPLSPAALVAAGAASVEAAPPCRLVHSMTRDDTRTWQA